MTCPATIHSRRLTAAVAIIIGNAVLVAAHSPARAQPDDCREPRSQSEMNRCSARELETVDRELNEVYQRVIERMVREGGDPPYDAASWERAMRKAQRAWVAYRDADCRGLVARDWTGGSGAALAINGCMTALTRRRISVLRERYGER